MTQSLIQEPVQSYTDSNGYPLNGGQLFTYSAGTLTPKATFQDAAGEIPNTNPIILNERGEAVVYGSGNYRMILKNAAGATIWDRDNVATAPTLGDLSGSDGASFIGYDDATLDIFLKSRLARVVDTIANLRALDKTKYTRAYVNGYHKAGDGGGGHFWYDPSDTSTADNAGTVIVASDGGRWKRIVGEKIDARAFGAIGDGTALNSTALQAAIDACRALKKILYIPTGTFMIERRLLVGSDTHIEGDGEVSVIKAVNNFPNSVTPWVMYNILFNDGTARTTPDSNIVLRNFCVDGNRSGQPSEMPNAAPLVYLVTKDGSEPMRDIIIDGMFVKNGWQNTTNGVMGILIENVDRCRIQNCRTSRTGRDGISVAGKSSNIIIANNYVEYSGDDAISVNAFAFNQSSNTVRVKNVVVSGNTIFNAGSRGVLFSSVEGGVIADNVIDGTTAWGITVEGFMFGANSDILVDNNKITRASQYAGDINGSHYQTCGGILIRVAPEETAVSRGIVVSNNAINTPAKHGIYVLHQCTFNLQQVDVIDNVVYACGAEGILVERASSGNIEQFNVCGNSIRQPTVQGIRVVGGYMARLSDNSIFNVGIPSGSAVDAILITNTVEVSLCSNMCIDSRGASAKQNYGIALNGVAGGILDGNTLIGSVTGPLFQSGSTNLVFGSNRPTIP